MSAYFAFRYTNERERERNKLYFNGCVLINKSPPVMCLANKPKKGKKICAVTLDVLEKASDRP